MALAAVLGIVAGDRMGLPPGVVSVIAGVTLTLAMLRPVAPLVLLAGALTFTSLHAVRIANISDFPRLERLSKGQQLPATVTGRVTQPPSDPRVAGVGIPPSRESDDKVVGSFTLQLESIEMAGQRQVTRHHVRVRMNPLPPLRPAGGGGDAEISMRYGDRVKLSGTLRLLPPARNPGSFDARKFFYRNIGAVAELNCGPGDSHTHLASETGHPLRHFAERSRAWLAAAICRDLSDSPDTAAILQAMTLGAREHTPDDIEEMFRLSGSLHIFAVSGMHVGIFAGIAWLLLSLLRLPRRVVVMLVIPAVLFYALVTGLRPSACRAAIMASVLLLGLATERQPRLLNSLGLAALVLLAIDSQQVFLPGFQLSFAVLAAIAILANPLRYWLRARLPLDPFVPRELVPRWRLRMDTAWSYCADLTALSLAAWVGSAVLVVWHFHLLTPISIVSNLLMVPLATVILAVACFSMLASAAHCGVISVLANNANWLLVKCLTLCAAGFAAVPGGHFSWTPSAGQGGPNETESADDVPLCQVVVIDTEDSGAANIIAVAPENAHWWQPEVPRTWLIDTGSESDFSRAVEPALRSMAVSRLDGLLLTHGDLRHIGGTPRALRNFSPKSWFQSHLPNRSPVRRGIETTSEQIDLPPSYLDNAQSPLQLEAGGLGEKFPVRLRVLYPPPDFPAQAQADDQALVVRLEAGPWRVLFLSDAGYPTERWLLDHRPAAELRADIIVKGQHNKESSGSADFIRIVDPIAVVATNASFPASERIPEAWRRDLQRRNIVLFDQSECGAVTIQLGSRGLRMDATLGDQTLRRRSR